MNGGDLRFGRVEDRLNLALLLGSQIQLAGSPSKAERVAMPCRTANSVSIPAWAGCATMIKAPRAIAPAAATANRFRFIVCFVVCLRSALRALKDMTACARARLQILFGL